MPLRQIDIYRSAEGGQLPPVEEEYDVIDRRDLVLENGGHLARLLVDTKKTEAIVDYLQDELETADDFRIVISAVAATLPRQEEEKEDKPRAVDVRGLPVKEEDISVSRISREEVYQEVTNSISVTNIHYMLVLLSAIVAAGGMLRDSPAVVIGAMVIAPLMGPNIALALGTTLADRDLLYRAARVNLLGLFIALLLAVVAGLVLPVDPTVGEIASRTEVNIGDVALALAAGIAGVLSVTRGVSTALIGVMVAVALLPPLVAVGLLLGNGLWVAALGAAILTFTNVVSINLAGVITFLAQDIRPTTWYEEEKAKKARVVAISLWLTILAVLIAVIFFAPPTRL